MVFVVKFLKILTSSNAGICNLIYQPNCSILSQK
jgi:hypothetical protein